MRRLFTCAMSTTGVVLLVSTMAHAAPPWLDEVRTIDGTLNNLISPDWGSVGTQLLRLTTPSYADGVSEPAGSDRPSARFVSNKICTQLNPMSNELGITDFIWQWGQFIDHDTTLVDPVHPVESFDIAVPKGDLFFDPDGTGTVVIPVERSAWDPASGTDPSNPRQQIEFITAYIDGSQVYGSDVVRAKAIRMNDGSGLLKTSAGDLLPYNVDGLPNFDRGDRGDPSLFFLAGDVRANEQLALTAMHTLWVREHNRLVGVLGEMYPDLTGDELYEAARAAVGAEIQAITYKEFLPVLLGPNAIPAYDRYEPSVNAGIANSFSLVYRVGHTLLSSSIQRLDENGDPIQEGALCLRDAFLVPDRLVTEGGIAPILRGLASQPAQTVDAFVIDDVRNFLFGLPGDGGFDLPAFNIQRGRDHGLPSYNQTRVDWGLDAVTRFDDISSNPAVVRALEETYADVDQIDIWVGAIAEDHVDGAIVGELLHTIVGDQFRRLRDGDRFWYQNVFTDSMLDYLESVRLSDIIRWNTEIEGEIADDVFHLASQCPGDANGDGAVNVLDLLVLLNGWGQSSHPGDIDGDGVVNILDLLLVLQNWGACPG